MGGDSAERQVSLNSGQAALDALQRKGVDAFAIDIRFNTSTSICQQLNELKIDIAFIALHGRGGEDGIIQSILDSLHIPYTGCDVAASALSMDKLRSKLLWSGAGLPTPEYKLVKADSDFIQAVQKIKQSLDFPVMVKPVHEGSSIGMSKAVDEKSLYDALQTASHYDQEILVEKWITGKEYTAAVLDGETMPLIRLETPREFYDYQAKYQSDDTVYHCPSGLDNKQEAEFQRLSLDAFNWIGASGWGRVDLMCDEQNKPWLIEINTVPGLTDHSLVPMAAKQQGMDFDELIYRILLTATNKV
jgi:D-alanine-D-alanine ligase